jgi:tRNA (adenine57-N1/adenine58-N1)-methyltransferase catalytic subunit
MTTLNWGEWVLLTSQKGKRWLVRIEDAPFSCHMGTIHMRDAVGKEEGDCLETGEGSRLFLFRPTLADYIFKMKRQTQIIFPKDLGAMIFYGDIRPGNVVLESGVGSGALSLALLRAVGETGRLISIEKRLKFAQLARDNVARFCGRSPANHHIVVGDIQDLALATRVDRALLDLPEPWHAVRHVAPFLRTGGILISLSPQVAQVQLTFKELKTHGFTHIHSFELLERVWLVDERRARPKDRMIGHTGFITVAKKISLASELLKVKERPTEENG